MKFLKDALTIAWMKSYPDIRRNPLLLIIIGMINALPLFFMVLFSRGELLIHGLIGAMVSTVSFLGLMSAIQDVAWDRYVKIREMFVAMPIHPISYAIGAALAPLLVSLPALFFFICMISWFGNIGIVSLAFMFMPLILCWLCMSIIGFFISTYLQKASPYMLNNLSNILGFGLIFLPPVYYPEEMLGQLSWISQLIPTSNVASLIRITLGLAPYSFENVVARWITLLVVTVIVLVLTLMKSRWRES
ncbi:MAG: ABC transporter permease [Candidatus Bathyarchaeia archaeon]